MSKYSRVGKVSKRGSVDSKYFGKLNQFETDINKKIERTEKFKNDIRNLILQDPSLIEQRYNNVVSVLLEIKKEFNI